MRRLRRILLRTAGSLVVLGLVSFGLLQTSAGQGAFFDLVSDLTARPDRRVSISGVSGFFPTDLQVQRIEVADSRGVWLTIERAHLVWSFRTLLHRKLDVEKLEADVAELLRMPEIPKDEAIPEPERPLLPLPIEARELTINQLKLGGAVAGVPSSWRIRGKAKVEQNGEGRIEMAGDRIDGPTGALRVTLDYHPSRQSVVGEILVEEGNGGLASFFLQQPGLHSFRTRMTIDGGPQGGRADFKIETAASEVTSEGQATWQRDDAGMRLSVELTGQAPGLPDGRFTRLVRAPFSGTLQARIDRSGIDIPVIRLNGSPGSIQGKARYLNEGERLTAELAAEVGEASIFELLVPGMTWKELKGTIQADGSLASLRVRARTTAASVAIEGPVVMRDLALSLDATVTDLKAASPGVRARLDANMASIVLPDIEGKSLPATPASLALDITRRGDGGLDVAVMEFTSLPITVSGKGRIGASLVTSEADARVEVPNLDFFSEIAGEKLAGRLRLDLTMRQAPGAATTVQWRAELVDAAVPRVPPSFLTPTLALQGALTVDRARRWTLTTSRAASTAFSLELSGQGQGGNGEIAFTLDGGKLASIEASAQGRISGKGKVRRNGGDVTASVELLLEDADLRGVRARRIELAADARLANGAFDARVDATGELAGQPLKLTGATSMGRDGSLVVPRLDLQWAGTTAEVRNLTITRERTDGSARIRIARLVDFAPFAGIPLSGTLEIDADSDPATGAGKLQLAVRGSALATGAIGAGELRLQGSIVDPLGRGELQAEATLDKLHGVSDFRRLDVSANGTRNAVRLKLTGSGGGTRLAAGGRVLADGEQVVVELASLDLGYAQQTARLAAPTKVRLAGTRVSIEPTTITLSGGRLRIAGSLDSGNSDLAIDIAGLPLAPIAALVSDVELAGVLDGRVQVHGSLSSPQVTATYTARDIRARHQAAALLPPATLTGTAALDGRNARFDARLAAARGNELALKGTATLPAGSGPVTTQVSITGGADMAVLAPLLGPDVRDLGGRLRADVTASIVGPRVTARGTVQMNEARLSMPSRGMRLERGEGLIQIAGDVATIERLTFRTPGNGEIGVTGTVQIDPDLDLPMQLRIAARNARLVSRQDFVLTVSSDLRLTGSDREGMALAGTVTVDRGEISLTSSRHAAKFPTVPVREINKPTGKGNRVVTIEAEQPSGKPIRLDLAVDAPRGIFVRGRGLDAELGGRFTVTGGSNRPVVLGGTQLRRGTFNLAGQRLEFTRGMVSLVNANKIEPLLDFVATTRSGSTTINVEITGTPEAPKIALTSKPPLPQDEIMAMLLFGKATSSLSPFEVAQVIGALAELTGTVSSGGMLDQVRRATGLDRLGLASDNVPGSKTPSTSLEAGRYVAPGIYVGAKQGATAGSSRAVVEVEVLRNTKIEADVGTGSTGRLGVKMEWDY